MITRALYGVVSKNKHLNINLGAPWYCLTSPIKMISYMYRLSFLFVVPLAV